MRHARPGATGEVSKEVFLEVYCEIRPLALNQYNIKSIWKKSGLLSLDPSIVLSKLKQPKTQENQES